MLYLPDAEEEGRESEEDQEEEGEEDGVEGHQLPHLPPRGVDDAAPAAAHVDALGKCKGDRSEFAVRRRKHILHCNKNPNYLLLEKELHDLSPAAPAAAHVDAL